jgi:Transposase DDE domain
VNSNQPHNTYLCELTVSSAREGCQRVGINGQKNHHHRFDNRDAINVYAVYATEIDSPEGETPLEWMLLTTEVVDTVEMADTILRWYTYRWRVEEYHKIFKSGCQIERYRLAAVGMKTMLGFLSVIAVELLQVTYLHRTQPDAPALEILNPIEIEVLKAGTAQATVSVDSSCLGCRVSCCSGWLSRTST